MTSPECRTWTAAFAVERIARRPLLRDLPDRRERLGPREMVGLSRQALQE